MSSSRRTLTAGQIEQILAMREEGRTYGQIVRAVKCTRSAARYHCLQNGVDKPGNVRYLAAPAHAKEHHRGGHVVRRFSQEDDVLLRVLRMQGFGMPTIAKRMRRPYGSIRGRLLTLARQDAIREEAA